MSNATESFVFELMLNDYMTNHKTTLRKKTYIKRYKKHRYNYYKHKRASKIPNLVWEICRKSDKPYTVVPSVNGWGEHNNKKATNKIIRRSDFEINGNAYRKLKNYD